MNQLEKSEEIWTQIQEARRLLRLGPVHPRVDRLLANAQVGCLGEAESIRRWYAALAPEEAKA